MTSIDLASICVGYASAASRAPQRAVQVLAGASPSWKRPSLIAAAVAALWAATAGW